MDEETWWKIVIWVNSINIIVQLINIWYQLTH